MNPFAKCCGLYCSCLMVTGIIFFAILAVMESRGNIFLTREHPEATDEKVNALMIAMALNAVCLINCIACVVVGTRREKEEARKQAEEDAKRAKDGFDVFN
jgi:hypothetical protein